MALVEILKRSRTLACAAWRLGRALLRVRVPPDASHRRGLLVASASADCVRACLPAIQERFAHTQFSLLVQDAVYRTLAADAPTLDLEVISATRYVGDPLSLVQRLVDQQYDLTVVILDGEPGRSKLTALAHASGAAYILIHANAGLSFYVMVRHVHRIMGYCFRRQRLQRWGLIGRWLLSWLLAPVGQAILFVSVLPLLARRLIRSGVQRLGAPIAQKAAGE
jgi:hypothetical protein